MSETVTFEISDEMVRTAKAVAAQTDTPVADVLRTWLTGGMTGLSVETRLGDTLTRTDETVDQEQQRELAALLSRREEELSDAEYLRLDELLRLYRQTLVRRAQAITNWLAAGGLTAAESKVSRLNTVRSSMLYAIGYHAGSQTLEVVFNSGGIYRYYDVPPHVYQGLAAADSKGRYMWDHVFDTYTYERLRRRR
jgi:hypothetical protein